MELMLDFSKLSLRNNKMYESISELFIIIYSFENPNITFDELHKKFIEFYVQEVPKECIYAHCIEIINIMKYNYNCRFDIKFIVDFLSSSYGTEYLLRIYNMKCIIVS